jgi:ribose transport system ATP-binding protein
MQAGAPATTGNGPSQVPLLAIDDLTKSFGGTHALKGVSIDVRPGEVHGLVGQNGSGKSTVIKILSGFHVADGGTVRIGGELFKLPLPAAELRQHGIEFVHQDLGLVPTMSVLENLRVGRYTAASFGKIRWRRERARALELLHRFELDDVDPDSPVARLSATGRSIVAILRALQDVEGHRGSGVLILDEPTAALPAHEVHRLFETVRRIRDSGSGVLLVTHNLDEVFEIADRVSVLRDGEVVARRATADLDHDELIELIVGKQLAAMEPPEADSATGQTALEVDDLRGGVVAGVSLRVRRGEILGLTGLVGSGHEDVPYLVSGAVASDAGTIRVGDRELDNPTPRRAQEAGVVLLPADRQSQSAILGATVKENVTMPALGSFTGRLGRIDRRRERTAVEAVLGQLNVVPPNPDRTMLTLSGGNQQKALIGRCLRLEPRVLLLHEPTQGVDVGARRGIFEILRQAAHDGAGIVYSSVQYEDLANVCDRVLVFRRGQIVAELSGTALTKDAIVARCYQTAA